MSMMVEKALVDNHDEEITLRESAISDAIKNAEELLSQRFGGNAVLTEPEVLGGTSRALVLRVKVMPNPFLQMRTVIIKQLPSSPSLPKTSLLREVVAYQFTTSLPDAVRPGPQLVAYDIDKLLLVISDLGDVRTFLDVLAEDDEFLTLPAFRALGATLGQMHVGTANKEPGFDALRRRMWAKHHIRRETVDQRDRGIVRAIEFGLRCFEGSGLPIPEEVKSFASDSARRVEKGTHRCFTPFDLSPSNILLADKVQFLDYEWAGYRDVIFDIASVVAGFPLHVRGRRPTRNEAAAFLRSWLEEIQTDWGRDDTEPRLTVLLASTLTGWLCITATVCFFGTAEAALTASQDEIDALTPSVRVSDAQLSDMEDTAQALKEIAAQCDDKRSPILVDWADSVINFLHSQR